MRKERQLLLVLGNWGYRMAGDTLISKAIKGYLSEQIVGRFKSVFAAAEHLIPIIHDDEYRLAVHKIMA